LIWRHLLWGSLTLDCCLCEEEPMAVDWHVHVGCVSALLFAHRREYYRLFGWLFAFPLCAVGDDVAVSLKHVQRRHGMC
jgi:hypothetical protein